MTEISGYFRALACAAPIVTSCAPAVAPPPPVPSACVVADEWARPRITVAVGATDHLLDAPSRPYPRVVAAQIFDTLIRTDCTGAPLGSLAAAWTPGTPSSVGDMVAASAEWRFVLRQDATFSDGEPVTAPAVAAAWRARDTGALESVTAVGEHDLRVVLRAPATAVHFALPALAITRSRDGGFLGSGPYATVTDVSATENARAGVRAVRLVLRDEADTVAAPGSGGARPDTIDARIHRDLRTALDAQVDAVVTGDPAVLAYARAIGDYAFVPLPWTRTWVLATSPLLTAQPPRRSDPDDDPAATFPAAVVGTDVRSAAAPPWWHDCMNATTGAPRGDTDGRVLYVQDDAVGRVIAERIAALAHDRAPQWLRDVMRADRPARAIGVSAAELAGAVRTGSPLAVVTAVPRSHDGCRLPGAYEELFRRWHVTALVDARDQLIHRPGIGRVEVDGDGTIRFGVQ